MKRFAGIAGAMLLSLVLFVPVALAADPFPHTGRVLVSTGGDVTVPEGEHADVVIVVNGTATIRGEVNTIVVIEGAANLLGARTETLFAVRSPVELGPGTVVVGDVVRIDSLVHQTGNAQIRGQVTDMVTVLIGIGSVLAPALLLLWIGFGLATIVVGLLLAGLASRQVRDAEILIRSGRHSASGSCSGACRCLRSLATWLRASGSATGCCDGPRRSASASGRTWPPSSACSRCRRSRWCRS